MVGSQLMIWFLASVALFFIQTATALADSNQDQISARQTATAIARQANDLANACAQHRPECPSPTPSPTTTPTATVLPTPEVAGVTAISTLPNGVTVAINARNFPLPSLDHPLRGYLRPTDREDGQNWTGLELPEGRWDFRFVDDCSDAPNWSNVWLLPYELGQLPVLQPVGADALCGLKEWLWHSAEPCGMQNNQCEWTADPEAPATEQPAPVDPPVPDPTNEVASAPVLLYVPVPQPYYVYGPPQTIYVTPVPPEPTLTPAPEPTSTSTPAPTWTPTATSRPTEVASTPTAVPTEDAIDPDAVEQDFVAASFEDVDGLALAEAFSAAYVLPPPPRPPFHPINLPYREALATVSMELVASRKSFAELKAIPPDEISQPTRPVVRRRNVLPWYRRAREIMLDWLLP